nr:MAG TPA: hypothetical protein [Bacteriophage sp.]
MSPILFINYLRSVQILFTISPNSVHKLCLY